MAQIQIFLTSEWHCLAIQHLFLPDENDVEGIGKDAGFAYIFERTKGHWTLTQKLVAPDGKAEDRFANGVALSKDTALISAM